MLIGGKATTNSSSPGLNLPISAEVNIAASDKLVTGSASVDLSAVQQFQPRRGDGMQSIGWRVYADDVQVTALTQAPITVSRSLDRSIQTAQIEMAAADGLNPLGNPLSGSLIGGVQEFDVRLAYRDTNAATYEEPLLSSGIVVRSPRQIAEAVIDSVSIADRGQRFADVPVTYQLPAGSQAPRTLVVRRLADLAGATERDIPALPGVLAKPVDLVEGDWIDLSNAILEVVGGRLVWDRAGLLTVRVSAPERERGPFKWILTGGDIVREVNGSLIPIGVAPVPDAWTYVRLVGTKQVTAETCGERTERAELLNRQLWGSERLTFQQQSSGTVTSLGGATQLPVQLQLVSQVIVRTTMRCDTVIAEKTETWGYENFEVARYLRNADGTVNTNRVVYLRADDPNEIGYNSQVWSWRRLSEVTVSRRYDENNFLVEQRETRKEHYNPRAHFKSRASGSDSWETASADSTYQDLAEFKAVVGNRPTFQRTRELIREDQVENGYVSRRVTTERAFGRKGGVTYLYEDGEFGEAQESFQTVTTVTDEWIILSEGRFKHRREVRDIDGRRLEETIDTDPPPNAEKADFGTPVLADYPSAEEFSSAVAAARFESAPIEAECSITSPDRRTRELDGMVWEWAENESELEAICQRLLIEGRSPVIEVTLPANPLIQEGDWCVIDIDGTAIAGVAQVAEIVTDGAGLGPWLTRARIVFHIDSDVLDTTGLPGGLQ